MNLQKALDIFIGQYKPSTARAYLGCLDPLLAYLGPSRDPDSVKPVEVTEYVNHLKSDERGLALTTQQKHIKTIKTFFRWMYRSEVTATDKSKELRQRRVPTRIGRHKAMTEDELATLRDFLKWHTRNYAILLFLADTGCRAGGVASLVMGPPLSAGQSPTEPGLYLDRNMAIVTEKGEKERPVAFGEATKAALAAWLLRRPRVESPYIFVTNRGTPLTTETISQMIRRSCEKVGIRSLGAHSLRHRKGHQLADNRVAITVAATVLGHSDPGITANFYFPNDWDRARAAAEQLFVDEQPTPKPLPKVSKLR